MNFKAALVLIALFFAGILPAREEPTPLLAFGGGYFDSGNHSGGLFQIDYRFGNYCFWCVRPQATFITPQCRSVFVGLGLGIDFYLTKFFVITPSFSPGVYFKGKGKDLGYPLEFRSSIEAAIEWKKARLGGQFYHISNASLSSRNPGANAYVLYLAIPLR